MRTSARPLYSLYSSDQIIMMHKNKSVLLLKEVIQPHLPVRLPCYDFIPITNNTFGGFLQ